MYSQRYSVYWTSLSAHFIVLSGVHSGRTWPPRAVLWPEDLRFRSIRFESWNCSIRTRSSKTLHHKRPELFLIRSLKDHRDRNQFLTNRGTSSKQKPRSAVRKPVSFHRLSDMFLAKFILFSVLQVLSCHAEYYSSTSGLEKLFETEVVLLAELQNYVNEINQHAEALQR